MTLDRSGGQAPLVLLGKPRVTGLVIVSSGGWSFSEDLAESWDISRPGEQLFCSSAQKPWTQRICLQLQQGPISQLFRNVARAEPREGSSWEEGEDN